MYFLSNNTGPVRVVENVDRIDTRNEYSYETDL